MSPFEALLLGIIQGVTEFLPVSSSGHLKLGQLLFGFEHLQDLIPFDVTCHFGTLLAILVAFRKDLRELLFQRGNMLWWLFIALLPCIPLYFLRPYIKEIFDRPQTLGYFFLLTSLFLFLGTQAARHYEEKPRPPRRSHHALIIGVFQALAVLPGVSRSGSTIASAQTLGWTGEEAARFSFLLAIPTMLAAILVESKPLFTQDGGNLGMTPSIYMIGFVSSFVVGLFSLRFLMRIIKKGKWLPFAWYCLILGMFTLFYVNLGQ